MITGALKISTKALSYSRGIFQYHIIFLSDYLSSKFKSIPINNFKNVIDPTLY